MKIELNDEQLAAVQSNKSKILVASGAGAGKCQPDYTLIPTPQGLRRLDELQIGDTVYGRFGQEEKILGIFPQGEREIYEVELSDGRVVECCKDHLWSYDNGHGGLTTHTLAEIIKLGFARKNTSGGINYTKRIPNLRVPVQFTEKKLLIDPYVIGCFIGDGCCTESALTISSNDEELVQEIANLTDFSYEKCSTHNYSWRFLKTENEKVRTKQFFSNYKKEICCRCGEKSIPADYLFSSVEQRLFLLQGLMDTDGYIGDGRHSPSFSTTSKKLAEDVAFLGRSLGYHCSIYRQNRKDKKSLEYEVKIFTGAAEVYKIVRLSRKREKAKLFTNKNRINHNFESIIDIRPTGKYTSMRCILVDDPEHLYLTNDFVVTHNTRVIMERIKFLLEQGVEPQKIFAITFTNAAAAEMKERLDESAKDVFIGTIHGLANRILLRNGIDTSEQIQNEDFDWLLEKVYQTEVDIPIVEHLLVDEFQDICEKEYNFFIKDLQPENWFFVGDSQQSIYSFKGANYRFFVNLTLRPDVTVYKLTKNYRSGSSIIDFAESFLNGMDSVYRVKNQCASNKEGYVESSEFSVDKILNELDYDPNYGKWFILCRTNNEVEKILNFLKKNNIPCDSFHRSELNREEMLKKMKENTVKVLTIHTSKGLENNNVIVIGTKNYNEEERRISYVAATRAKDNLFWLIAKPIRRRKKSVLSFIEF